MQLLSVIVLQPCKYLNVSYLINVSIASYLAFPYVHVFEDKKIWTIFKFEKLNNTMLTGISKILTILNYTLQFFVRVEKSFKHLGHMGYKKSTHTNFAKVA